MTTDTTNEYDDYGLSIDKVEAAIRAEARFLEPIAA